MLRRDLCSGRHCKDILMCRSPYYSVLTECTSLRVLAEGSSSGMWRAERQSTHHLLASPIFVHLRSLVTARRLCRVQRVGHFEYGMYEKVLCYTNFLGMEWLKYFQSCTPRMRSRLCRDLYMEYYVHRMLKTVRNYLSYSKGTPVESLLSSTLQRAHNSYPGLMIGRSVYVIWNVEN